MNNYIFVLVDPSVANIEDLANVEHPLLHGLQVVRIRRSCWGHESFRANPIRLFTLNDIIPFETVERFVEYLEKELVEENIYKDIERVLKSKYSPVGEGEL